MKINNPLIRKIGATLIGLLLLIYVGYQIYIVNYKGLNTETATYAELSDTVQTSGWVIRNETIVDSSYSGVLNYNFNNGDRISKDSSIADVFATEEDAAAQSKMKRLDSEILNLESLREANQYYTNSPDMIGTQINDSVVSILGDADDNDYVSVSESRARLQMLLNQKRIIIGSESVADYQSRITALQNERSALQASTNGRIDYITSPCSGYFINSTDGYENSFDYEKVLDMTVSDIESVKQSDSPDAGACKIAEDFSWYIAAVVDEPQKIKLEKNTDVYVEIPFATSEKIPAQVLALNKDDETGKYALVLKCDYMNSEIAAIRNETVQIVVNTYSGVLVNQKSIHFEDITKTVTDEDGNSQEVTYENVKGVYVKYGSKINFVQIFSDVTINGYAVCKTDLSEEEKKLLVTENTIGLYDEVVTGGTNLYDGKLL